MSILIKDEATIATLSGASGPEDVRATDGRILGRFIPRETPTTSFPEIGLSDAELEMRRTDLNALGHTANHVMTRLRELDKCSL